MFGCCRSDYSDCTFIVSRTPKIQKNDNMKKILLLADELYKEAPFLAGISTPQEHLEALELIESLLTHDYIDGSIGPKEILINVLGVVISNYEDTAPEFAEFNAGIANVEEVTRTTILHGTSVVVEKDGKL